MHVLPPCSQRQAHQDAFDSGSRRVEPEAGATVVHQVELDVASASQLLPFFLLRGERHVSSLVDDGIVGWEEGKEAILNERKDRL